MAKQTTINGSGNGKRPPNGTGANKPTDLSGQAADQNSSSETTASHYTTKYKAPDWSQEDEAFLNGIIHSSDPRSATRRYAENRFDAENPIADDDIEERVKRIKETELVHLDSQMTNVMADRGNDPAYVVVQTTTRNSQESELENE